MPENINRHTGSTDILNSYTLFPSETRYLLAVGWTLSYEFYFYLIFSIGLFSSYYCASIISMILLIISGIGFSIENSIQNFYIDFFTNSLLLEFLYGIIIAKIYISNYKHKFLLAYISFGIFIILMLFYLFGYQIGSRGIDLGLPALFLVLSITMLETKLINRKVLIFEKLGDMSYSLYLIHLFILGFVALVYRKLNIHTFLSEFVYLISMLLISIFISYFVYILIEKKLTNFFRHRTN